MSGSPTKGVLFIHSAPPALCPHIEWAVAGCISVSSVSMTWVDQPAAPGTLRAETQWHGSVGTGAHIASSLRGWEHLRFEVTEEPSPGCDGSRWTHTPQLGIHHAIMDASGNTLLSEDRVRTALDAVADANGESSGSSRAAASMRRGYRDMIDRLETMLGTAWDDELEPFRMASEGAPIRWLHQVG